MGRKGAQNDCELSEFLASDYKSVNYVKLSRLLSVFFSLNHFSLIFFCI